ncbi:restriction endonuclease subunit S [Guyparkeria sp. 1SP6A2]|nr:restriction endonuclease subunit S [Guyparkeria sp. 1SP6A2]
MSFPRYSEYKDSGVEWLGEVPAHWSVKRLRYVAGINPTKSEVRTLSGDKIVSFIPMELVGEDGSLDLKQTRPLEDVIDGYTYVRDGDVTFAKITPCFENGKAALMKGLESGIGFGTTELTVLRPKTERAISKYLFRVIHSEPFRVLGESHMYGAGGQKRVPDDFARNFQIAWPPLGEQSAIAAFLDHETARIDALIEEQKRLIELLKEKRQAVISHAVTKGLDPDVPMKDSGVEWLGEVPEHWDIISFRRVLMHIEQGWSPECSNVPAESGRWGVLKAGAVNKGVFEESKNKALPEKFEPRPNIEVHDGDLIMCRASGSPDLIGSVAYVEDPRPRLMLSDKLFRLVVNAYVSSVFIADVMSSGPLRRQIEQSINGAEGLANNLSQATIKELWITLPPLEEQRRITEYLTDQKNKIENLVDSAERAVSLLQERRSALISAAVTGKMDVRGWRAESNEVDLPKVAEQDADYSAREARA